MAFAGRFSPEVAFELQGLMSAGDAVFNGTLSVDKADVIVIGDVVNRPGFRGGPLG